MNSTTNLTQENNDHGSDSDTNPDVSPEYYQPISALADNDDDDSDEEQQQQLGAVEIGVSCLDLNGDVEQNEEEEEEDERVRQASDSAILTAFRDDETRRNAPLTPETATRVMEAMRGISFAGSTPDWAGRLPEDQWIRQLRTLRQHPQN